METFGYKSKRDIYKDTLFLSVGIHNKKLFVTPLHQDGPGSYGTVIKDNQEFEYSITLILSSEELGKAVMEAFEYSTSIYKKK